MGIVSQSGKRQIVLVNTNAGPMNVSLNDASIDVGARAVALCEVGIGQLHVVVNESQVPAHRMTINRPTKATVAVDFLYLDVCGQSRFVLLERLLDGSTSKPYKVLREYSRSRLFTVRLKDHRVRYVHPFAPLPKDLAPTERAIKLVPIAYSASRTERLACMNSALDLK